MVNGSRSFKHKVVYESILLQIRFWKILVNGLYLWNLKGKRLYDPLDGSGSSSTYCQSWDITYLDNLLG